MAKFVYTAEPETARAELISPAVISGNLWRHRELILTVARREFQAAHRGTILGRAWPIVTPLIMLGLFTLVFGYIFNGKFSRNPAETPAEFAVAMFVGLNLYQCVGTTLSSAPSLMLANAAYVKTLSFPLQILPVASVLNVLWGMAISLLLCFAMFFALHGYLHVSTIALVPIILCILLMCLGLAWFLSAVSVFVRDTPAIVSPLAMVLMFMSAVFFPASSVPARLQFIFKINPLAVLIEEGRGAVIDGRWPDPMLMLYAFIVSVLVFIGGHWFFGRMKPAFADVM